MYASAAFVIQNMAYTFVLKVASKSGSVALRFQVEEMGRAAFERKSLPRSYAANE